MQTAKLMLTVSTIALGLACIRLYMLLDAERATTRQLAARIQQLEDHVAAGGSMAPPVQSPVAAADPSVTGATREGAAQQAAAPYDRNGPLAQARQQVADVYANDPAVQKMMRESKQRPQWMQYGDLVKMLGLSPDQADQFIQLLTEQRARLEENAQLNESDPAAALLAAQDIKARTDAAVMSLLGADGYREYERYQTTLMERNEINVLGMSVSALQAPLSEDQRSRLLAAMLDEKARVPPPGANGGTSSLMEVTATREGLQWFDAYFKRVRERFSSILTPEQMKEFDRLQLMRTHSIHMDLQTIDSN